MYHYAAAENSSDKAIVSVELQTVEGGASKGDPFTVKEELSVELLDQNILQITVDNVEEHFSVGI